MLYKALGFFVWKAVKLYLRQKVSARRTLALGALGLVGAAVASALAGKRGQHSG